VIPEIIINKKPKKTKIPVYFEKSIEIPREKAAPFYQIINFKINDIGGKKKELLVGNYYLIDLDSFSSHFHFLNDQIGEYLVIKEYIKDLVPIVFSKMSFANEANISDHNKTSKYIYDSFLKVGIGADNIYNLNDFESINIENLFATQKFFNQYLTNEMIPIIGGTNPKYSVPAIKKYFFSTKKSNNKKLFISRVVENNHARDIRKKLEEKRDTNHKAFLKFKAKLGEDLKIKIFDRYITLEDELFLERFFKDNGYEIINPGEYSLQEQIDMFAEASHVAGLSGAGFINTMFCYPGTKIIILNTSTAYSFPHHKWPRAAGCKVFNVPETIKLLNCEFGAKEIITDLQNRKIII